MSKTSDFSLSMSGLSDSADVQLIYDFNKNKKVDSGDILFSDYGYSYGDATINSVLGKGTYFVKVFTDSSYDNTNYTLSLLANR